jgi:hypothetical protein
MAADTGSGGINQLEDHYNTFIVSLNLIVLVVLVLMEKRRPSKILPRSQVRVSTLSAYPFRTGPSRHGLARPSWDRRLGSACLLS